jgi:hypothetical protein
MNDKFIVKFEAGPMEQAYKILQSEVLGVEGLKKMVDAVFIEQVNERFNEMYLAYKSAKTRLIELK